MLRLIGVIIANATLCCFYVAGYALLLISGSVAGTMKGTEIMKFP